MAGGLGPFAPSRHAVHVLDAAVDRRLAAALDQGMVLGALGNALDIPNLRVSRH